MLLTCPNKECRKLSDVKLNEKTNEVVCESCGNVIPNVTSFVKNNLRANKEFIKVGTKSNFNVKCSKCGRVVGPLLVNNKVTCPDCKGEITLSKAFENVFRESYRKS